MKKDDYKAHGIHTVIEALSDSFTEIQSFETDESGTLRDEAGQLEYLKWCLEKSDERLLTINLLDSLQSKLNNCTSAARNLIAALGQPENAQRDADIQKNKNSISSNLANCLDELGYPRVQQVFRSEATAAIEETIAAADEAILAIQRDSDKKRSLLQEKIENLEKEIEKNKQLVTAEEKRIDDLKTKNSQFEASLTANSEAKAKEFDGLIVERRTQLEEWRTATEKAGSEYLEKIEKLYRMSADTTLAGRFIEASRTETRSYVVLTILSLVFFIGAVIALFVGTSNFERLINVLAGGPMSALVARLSIVATFLLPATLFANQASKHRRASIWYRTMGVRVATLKPYLAEFEETKVDYNQELKDILKQFFASELKLDSDKTPSTWQLGLLDRLVKR